MRTQVPKVRVLTCRSDQELAVLCVGGGVVSHARNVEPEKQEALSSAVAAKKRGKKVGAKRAPKTMDTEDLFS
jgi:hypothetical protein